MTLYSPPSRAYLAAELARAGADENQQAAGVMWIEAMLFGSARSKTPGSVLKQQRAIESALRKAQGEFNKLPDLDKDWLRKDVGSPIEHAMSALSWVGMMTQSERAHRPVAEQLRHFFVSENLPVVLSDSSPFVRIFAHCAGLDSESGKTTLRRLFGRREQKAPN